MTINFWDGKIKIGNLEFPKFMSAPIDGITDSPLRQLIREFCPEELLFTEMRHVASIANAKTQEALIFENIEHPLCFQVSANKTDFIEKATEKILSKKIAVFNLNAGCPAKNIIKSGSGSALMAKPQILKEIIISLTKNINARVPLTLKIRAGFKEKNAFDISLMAQDLGVQAIIIHPRLQTEGFTSPLDFDLVRKIKEKLQIPVIFSGNINSAARVKLTYEQTGVDGFMIGRALYGAPWKIHEIKENLADRNFEISIKHMLKYALKHLDLAGKYYGQNRGFHLFKKQVTLYIRKVESASLLRKKLLLTQTQEDMENILKSL